LQSAGQIDLRDLCAAPHGIDVCAWTGKCASLASRHACWGRLFCDSSVPIGLTESCMLVSSHRRCLARMRTCPPAPAYRAAPCAGRSGPQQMSSGGARFFLDEVELPLPLPVGPGLRVGGRVEPNGPLRSAASHSAIADCRSRADDVPATLSESDMLPMLPSTGQRDCASHSARSDSASLAAACAAVSSAARRCLGELGGEKVGDGDDGVGGSAVSFHTRCVTSLRPSAAARVSRSSSRVGSVPGAAPDFGSPPFCRLGELGGEHVGEGLRGVGGRLRSSAGPACMVPARASRKERGPDPEDEAPPADGGGGDRASGWRTASLADPELLGGAL